MSHINTRHISNGDFDRPFSCPKCRISGAGNNLNSATEWLLHTARAHGAPLLARCLLCERLIKENGLERHVLFGHKHEFKEPFPCPECSRTGSLDAVSIEDYSMWRIHVAESHGSLVEAGGWARCGKGGASPPQPPSVAGDGGIGGRKRRRADETAGNAVDPTRGSKSRKTGIPLSRSADLGNSDSDGDSSDSDSGSDDGSGDGSDSGSDDGSGSNDGSDSEHEGRTLSGSIAVTSLTTPSGSPRDFDSNIDPRLLEWEGGISSMLRG